MGVVPPGGEMVWRKPKERNGIRDEIFLIHLQNQSNQSDTRGDLWERVL